MITGMLLDGVVVAALVAAMLSGARLSKKINSLQILNKEMQSLTLNFVQATSTAEAAIKDLKDLAARTKTDLDNAEKKALTVADDLALLMKRADSLADSLEAAVHTARGQLAQIHPKDAAATPGTAGDKPAVRSRTENELLEAVVHAS